MEDNKRKLYDALSAEYDLGTFEQFSTDIQDADKRKKLYDATINDYDFGDFDSFSNQLGLGSTQQEQPIDKSQYTFTERELGLGGYQLGQPIPIIEKMRRKETEAGAGTPMGDDIYRTKEGQYTRTEVPFRTIEYPSLGMAQMAARGQQREDALAAYRSAYNRLEAPGEVDERTLIEWGNNMDNAPIEQKNLYARIMGKDAANRVDLDAVMRSYDETKKSLEGVEDPEGLAAYLIMPAEQRVKLPEAERNKYEAALEEVEKAELAGNVNELHNRLSSLMEQQRRSDIKMREEYEENRGVGGFLLDALLQLPVAENPRMQGTIPSSQLDISPEGVHSNEQNAALTAAGRKWNEMKHIIDAAANGDIFDGLDKALSSADTWSSDQMLRDGMAIQRVVDKFDKNGREALTENEKALLDAIALNVAVSEVYGDEISNWYKGGEMIGEMVPYVIEMLMNPLSGVGRKVAEKITRAALKKYGKELVKKKAGRFALKRGAAKLGASVAGATGMALTTGLPAVGADIQRRMLGDATYGYDNDGNIEYTGHVGGEDLGTSAYKAVTSRMLDNVSEMLGAGYAKIPFKWLQKVGKGTKVLGWMDNLANSKTVKQAVDFMEKAKWHGPIEEFLEEVHVGLINPVLVGDHSWEEFFTADNLATIAIGVAVPGAAISALNTIGGAADGAFKVGAQERWKMQTAAARGAQLWKDNPGEWRALEIELSHDSMEDIEKELKKVYNNPELTPEQKKVALEYAVYSLQWRTAQGVKEAFNEGKKFIDPMLRDIYGTAYEQRIAPMEANKAYRTMTEAEKNAQEILGIGEKSVDEWLNGRTAEEAARSSKEKLAAIKAYQAAKLDFEGRRDRFIAERDIAYMESDRSIQAHDNNGMVYATQYEGQPVYITGGDVVLLESGKIDFDRSSESLYVKFPDGHVEMIAPENFSEVFTEDRTEDLKAAKRAEIDERWKAEFDTAEVLAIEQEKREAGVVFDKADAQGNHRIEILNEGEDMSNILFDGAETEISTEELNRWKQEAGIQTESAVADDATDNGTPTESEANVAPTGDNVTPVAPVENNELAPVELPDVPDFFRLGGKNYSVASRNNDGSVDVMVDGKRETLPAGTDYSTHMPTDKKGEVQYEQMPVERTHEYFVQKVKDDEARAEMIEKRRKKAEAERKKFDKKPDPGIDPDAYEAKMTQWEADKKAAQAKVDYWKEVAKRDAEITRSETREAVNNIKPDVVEETADEFIANQLAGIKITPESFKRETGLSNAEQAQLVGVISNDGVSVERAAEIISENYDSELKALGFTGDMQDVRDIIIDILSQGNPRSYAKKGREAREAENMDQQRADAEAWAKGAFDMKLEELYLYEETILPRIMRDYEGFDENEYYSNLAENNGYDTTRESESIGQGGELLQGEQPVPSGGTPVVGQRNEGGAVSDDVQGGGQNGVAQEEVPVINEPVGNSEQLSSSEIPNNQSVAGLEGYSTSEILDLVKGHIFEALGEDVRIVDMRIIGSRTNGTNNADSDLDVLVEYEGDISEDSFFNAVNDEEGALYIDGIRVDINPITKDKSGSIEQWMNRNKGYSKAEGNAPGQSGVYSLSELTDNEGNRFYQKNGSIDLWDLSPLFVQARRQNAPIRLTERNIDHILDEHKKELGDSEESVLKFLDDVFSTAKVLRKARSGGIFVVVENTKTDKAAIIRLYPSKYGDYYNVESAGYYRKNKWKDTENVIAELSEPTQSVTASDVSKPQVPEEGGKELLNAETATTSVSEDRNSVSNSQENTQKSGEIAENGGEKKSSIIEEAEAEYRNNPLHGVQFSIDADAYNNEDVTFGESEQSTEGGALVSYQDVIYKGQTIGWVKETQSGRMFAPMVTSFYVPLENATEEDKRSPHYFEGEEDYMRFATLQQMVDYINSKRQQGEIQEPRSVEEDLDNGDKRITNYNSRGEVATVAIERDGKVVSVDSYDEGVLFEHTEYDGNGKATSVTRYDKQGNVVGTQVYEDGKAKTPMQKLADRILDRTEEKRRIPLRERARELEAQVGVKANIIESLDEVKNREARERIVAGEAVAGWYSGGQVYLYMPNIKDRREIELTYVHEVVAHHGVKKLLGERFNEFLDGVWSMMSEADRARMLAYVGVKENSLLINQEDMRAAADEYVAELAEKMNLGELEQSTWEKIVDWFKKILENIGFENLTKEDIESMLKASYANLRSTEQGAESKENDFRARMTFHGSGSQFDRFDHAFMGTGEGAQAFGWGTYVTEVEGIGKQYAEAVVQDKNPNIEESVVDIRRHFRYNPLGIDVDTIEDAKRHLDAITKEFEGTEDWNSAVDDIEDLRGLIVEWEKLENAIRYNRNLYSVEIPDDNGSNYLHWENVVPKKVETAVKERLLERLSEGQGEAYKSDLKRELDDVFRYSDFDGASLYKNISAYLGGDKQASQFLNDMGFVGISYPAEAMTGGRADGARNYVIFNENDAEIKDYVEFRQGDGPLTDREVVMESDVYSKVLGKPRYYGQKQRNYVARQRAKMAQKATELAEKLNTPIEVRETAEGLTGKKAKAKGWYDVKSGNIVVVVSNHGSIEDIQATVLHEVVAHKGLRQMFGKHFDTFLDNVYNNVDAEIRAEIDALTEKYGNTREATEEYLASLAENTYFEKVNPSLWSRIKQWFLNMLTEVGIKLDFELSDNELRYILWRSHQRLINPGIYNPVTRITDVAVRARLGIGEYAPAVEEMSHVAEEDAAEYANKNQDIFVSNAQRAVEGIQQNKATAEQWIAMLKKNGGLKAGEDAWLGLEEWLNEKQGAVTKQEILDYITENRIQIEEVNYTQFGYGLMDEATRKLEAELKEIGWDAMVEKYPGFDELFEVYNGELLWSEERASVGEYEDFIIDNKIVDLDSQSNAINETREKYTTEGLERKREIALTVPTIEPYNASDEIHFGDAGNGRAVAWVRFGETVDSEGNRVLVIDEIQSMRHQEGREKGYGRATSEDVKSALEAVNAAQSEFDEYNAEMVKKYGSEYDWNIDATDAEIDKWQELYDKVAQLGQVYEDVAESNRKGIPSAPFEKNWHELAMKRMLRLAAEEGFDKVAWTTGEQQAQRYDMSKVVSHIACDKVGKNGNKSFSMGLGYKFIVDPNGIVVSSKDEYVGKSLADIVGKPLANKMLEMQEGDTISGDGLRIGGEGMKGFYDRMLPSFVQKYTKKWGAKVGEVTMPSLEENNTMWSVDVTPEMQESVMQGQTMFRIADDVITTVDDFNSTHKGAAPTVIIDSADTLEEQLRAEGFSKEDIAESLKDYDSEFAYYHPTYDKVVINDHDVPKDELIGYLWHENAHRAVRGLYTREEMERLCDYIYKDDMPRVREVLSEMGYKPEELAEEAYVRGIEDVFSKKDYRRRLERGGLKPKEDATEEEKVIIDSVNRIVDFINNGREEERADGRRAGGGYAERSTQENRRGQDEEVRNSQETGENTQAGETRFRTVEETTDGSIDDVPAQPLTLMERIANSLLEVSAKNKENLELRASALRTFGRDVNRVLSLMKAQREYDKSTVDTLVKLAKMYFKNAQLLGEVDTYTMGRVLSLINNVVGKRDVTSSAAKLMDILLDAHTKALAGILDKAEKVKAKKVNAAGVEVMGRLDKYGQRRVDEYRAAKEMTPEKLEEAIYDSDNRLAELEQRVREELGLPEGDVDQAARDYTGDNDAVNMYMDERARLEGLTLAREYKESIQQVQEEIKDLKRELKQAEEDYRLGNIDGKSLKEFRKSVAEAIMESKAGLIEGYHSLIYKFQENTKESSKKAKAFVQAQIDRAREIQHNANSDLEGHPAEAQGETPDKWNSSVPRLFMSAMPTFQTMLKFFGEKAADGRGYLYERFIPQYTQASHNEYVGKTEAREKMRKKLTEIFGEKTSIEKFMDMSRKDGALLEYQEGGEKKTIDLTRGQVLYLYMINKMADGQMKLSRMGITDADVQKMAKELPEEFLKFADWVQEEFLTELREKYNMVHERMFGAPMAAIESYFPIKINKRSRGEKIEPGMNAEGKPSTVTGSIIKRTKNAVAIDLSADAMQVLLGHIDDMENWAAFAEFRRDVKLLLNYRHFQNQVMGMESLRYGSGEELWKNFVDVAEIAAGSFKPSSKTPDRFVRNIAKGVVSSKIAFRYFTAVKQILSTPAFWSEVDFGKMMNAYLHQKEAWDWAMKNLPGFSKRWEGRASGNEILLESDADWKVWQNRAVQWLSKEGMRANAFIDALTVATGAKAVFETKYEMFKKAGYSEERAREKALNRAAEAYNESQQSSESAYLSPLQAEATFVSSVLTAYRNSPFGYNRKMATAIANLKKKMKKGFKQESIEYMTKQLMRDGLNEEQAKKFAKSTYRRSVARDAADVALYGFFLNYVWVLGPSLIYILLGDDDEKKKELHTEALIDGAMGGLGNLPAGEALTGAIKAIAEGDVSNFKLPQAVAMQDIETIADMMQTDPVRAAGEVLNILVAMNVGVNPQTFTDMFVALADTEDWSDPRELAMLVLRLINAPNSKLELLEADEAMENYGANIEEITREFAEYQKSKRAPLSGWLYSDEGEQKAIERYEKRFKKILDERFEVVVENTDEYDMWYENSDPQMKAKLAKMRQKYLEGDKKATFEKLDAEELVKKILYGADYNEVNTVYYELSTAEDEDTAFIIKSMKKTLDDLKEGGKLSDKEQGLLSRLNELNYAINNAKRLMEQQPERAQEHMNNIRKMRAKAMELINNYRNNE